MNSSTQFDYDEIKQAWRKYCDESLETFHYGFYLQLEKIAKNNGLNVTYEVFADRNYNNDLTLVPRTLSHAIIQDKEQVLEHVKRMAYQSEVKTTQGSIKFIKAQTFCIHGDHKNSVEILEFLNRQVSTNVSSVGY